MQTMWKGKHGGQEKYEMYYENMPMQYTEIFHLLKFSVEKF